MRWKLNIGQHASQRSNARRCVGALLALATGSSMGAQLSAQAQFHNEVEPALAEYCSDCHADGARKGGVAFDDFKSASELLNSDLWFRVLKNRRAGLMPPRNKPQPSAQDQQKLEQWIKYTVFGIDAKNPDPGRVTVRRLNRIEYRNTIRDLLGVDYDTSIEFPPDDTGYGFDNIGDVLSVSPLLLEKYLLAASQIISEAVPVAPRVMPEQVIPGVRFTGSVDSNDRGNGKTGRKNGIAPLSLSFYEPAAVSNQFKLEVAGDYQLALDLAVKGNFEFIPAKCRVVITLDGKELLNHEYAWQNDKAVPRESHQHFERGEHQVRVTLEPIGPLGQTNKDLSFRILSMTVRGPLNSKFWIKPKNYEKFFAADTPPTEASERRAYAHEILRAFTTKAFRQPADSRTVDRLVALAEQVYNEPGRTFEAGVAHAMVGVLASPRFVFRIEDNLSDESLAPWGLVNEYALASRLSYFLWSSMPDSELFELAARGELRKNLTEQVKRMVEDSRSESLSQNFVGQWLEARNVDSLAINARAVFAREGEATPPPEGQLTRRASSGSTNSVDLAAAVAAAGGRTNRLNFGNVNGRTQPRVQLDQTLKRAMRGETEMYFSHIMHENRSVLELIDSDYTFVNANLAKVYGLTNMNITGAELRRVTLPPGSPRGGVLTSGTALTVTSNPDRTSPVKRGLFILSNILGTPVPPPPPNIPALEATEKDFKAHQPTLREALAVHRESPLCSSCHFRMDPIGLGFENFNALGVWRDKEWGQTIEPGGELVTGESFRNVQELKRILMTNHKADFYRCLTEKLLTYAVGRGMEYYDAETVDRIVARLDQENGRFNALLMGVIESAPFQKQRYRANPAFGEKEQPPRSDGVAQSTKTKVKS